MPGAHHNDIGQVRRVAPGVTHEPIDAADASHCALARGVNNYRLRVRFKMPGLAL
ncbi:hypothetical protein SAMN05216414_10625 [Nitrosovibrio sp. Nv17]|nr:hypothetical protein SAMN05216414_10625 [Nitrosovibrio sp. Nv17]